MRIFNFRLSANFRHFYCSLRSWYTLIYLPKTLSINFTTCFWTRNEIRCHGKGVLLKLELAWAERSSTGGIGRKGGRNWDGTLEMAFVCRAQWLKNWAKLKRCHMQRKWLRLPHIHALTQTQMDRHTYRYKQNLLRISPACRGHQIASHLWCNKRQHNLQRHQAIQSSDAPSLSFPLSAYPLCLSLFALLSQLAGIVNGICWPHSAHTHTNLERILSRKMVCPYPRANFLSTLEFGQNIKSNACDELAWQNIPNKTKQFYDVLRQWAGALRMENAERVNVRKNKTQSGYTR